MFFPESGFTCTDARLRNIDICDIESILMAAPERTDEGKNERRKGHRTTSSTDTGDTAAPSFSRGVFDAVGESRSVSPAGKDPEKERRTS